MRVLGTAGHVDHGKSALVKALTGIDPDRLQEEKDRQMTIDLGFAWMTLPSGGGLGIIDVPGHRDFIDNMLAGVGGIDAALLVVAADEGVMPQTREHLAILDLLAIPRLLVAITKADLVTDPDWIELVQGDIRELLRDSRYSEAELVAVSSRSGAGLSELVRALDALLTGIPSRPDRGRPRLPVDRAFTMPGFGTVVTGTLLDGRLAVGDEVEVLPSGLRARVRGLQSHHSPVEAAEAGSRVAANLSSVSVDQLQRGDVLAHPGTDEPTRMLDVSFRALPERGPGIRHNSSAKFFSGSAHRMARVRVLGTDQLPPGQDGWLQLVLDEPVVVRRGDRFILRRPSPGQTLGGGTIADPHPAGIHKRKNPNLVVRLSQRLSSDPEAVLLEFIGSDGPNPIEAAIDASGLDDETVAAALDRLRQRDQIVLIGPTEHPAEQWAIRTQAWDTAVEQARSLVGGYHRRFPLRRGMSLEELRVQFGRGAEPLIDWMVRRGVLSQAEGRVALPEFAVQLSPSQLAKVSELLGRFEIAPYRPPSWEASRETAGVELLAALLENGELVRISDEILLSERAYSRMREWVRGQLGEWGQVTVGQVRDEFATSRKYALAFLEHLDQIGVTIRQGDFHRPGPAAAS